MVDSKAGGVPVGGAQGTANAGASEFSGANFTYVKIDSGSDDWTAQAGTDGGLAHLVEWASQKGTVVVINGATSGLVYMIFEGPFGWGDSAAMQVSLRADDPTSISMASATASVTTALVLA
tara:strand:- start:639 stop:1001 length:363 start_codon:yes stop_codon:yes gene_type:complete